MGSRAAGRLVATRVPHPSGPDTGQAVMVKGRRAAGRTACHPPATLELSWSCFSSTFEARKWRGRRDATPNRIRALQF
jgi:hypothetical protein